MKTKFATVALALGMGLFPVISSAEVRSEPENIGNCFGSSIEVLDEKLGANCPLKDASNIAIEANKLIMLRFMKFINTADKELGTELIDPAAVFYVPGRPEPVVGPAGYFTIIEMMRSGFPDIQWTLDEMVVEEDKVAARFTMRGTHKGAFFGVPPTGKTIEVKAMNFYRLSGGKFVEEYGQPDLLGLLQQIGAIPAGA